MIDTVWFASNRPVNDTSRVLFISGDDLGQLPRGYHQITVKLEPYGTHHTKMSLLRFKGRSHKLHLWSKLRIESLHLRLFRDNFCLNFTNRISKKNNWHHFQLFLITKNLSCPLFGFCV